MNILDKFLDRFRSGSQEPSQTVANWSREAASPAPLSYGVEAEAEIRKETALRAEHEPDLILHTKHGDLNLARPEDKQKFRRMVVALQRSTDALTRKDLGEWRRAWQLAINVDYPNRAPLYDIYRDVDADLHLSGCIEQRREFVLAKSFKIVGTDGKENTDARHYFDQEWFKDYCELALESIWWGHSLIELGETTTDSCGCISLSSVEIVPRKHVIPEYHRIVISVGDDWSTGIDYREKPYSDNYIEIGKPDSLGKYLKAAIQTIPKKHALAFWDNFAEIFGMPMRVARTTTRDKEEWNRLQSIMKNSGSNLSIITGMDTEVQFVESGKGDAFKVYDKRIDRANSELSKLAIGQTMTIEDGSSLSQSETHLKIFMNLVNSDARMLRDSVNNKLIPRLIRMGFPLEGCRFEYDEAIDYTPEQQVAYETMISDRFEVDPSYFAEKYNMPVGRRLSSMPRPDDPGDDGSGDDGPDGNNSADGKEGADGKNSGKKGQNAFFD